MFVFLTFLPVFAIVASWIILIIHTSLLSFHTCTIMSLFLQNADCPFFKRLPSPSRSHGMPLLAFNSAADSRFCLVMFELISHCYNNCLDRHDDFGQSSCLKVITMCPTSFPQPSISPCYRYNPILPHTPFSPALHILSFSLDCMS